MRHYNIYGDNILECQEAAQLIAVAVAGQLIIQQSPLLAPSYELCRADEPWATITLLPGYGRWKYDAQTELQRAGARLREAPDALVTQVTNTESGPYSEKPILAVEFSGALPAGNNAWQRCGRALGSAQAGVPYLYFAELGGVELDENRNIIASRLPNPIVPFGYYALGQTYNGIALPVYEPSPSIGPEYRSQFAPHFGTDDAVSLVRAIVLGEDPRPHVGMLEAKALEVTKQLASMRSRQAGILSQEEWGVLGNLASGRARADWLLQRRLPWMKKMGIPTTDTFDRFLSSVVALGSVAVGSSDMPFCLVPSEQPGALAGIAQSTYGQNMHPDFLEWLRAGEKPLAVAWVTGFKPRGDDSRPDRGLVPLLRMVLGEGDVEVLTVICGPAKLIAWQTFARDMWLLAETNGLWQAVVTLSDGVLVDSMTSSGLRYAGVRVPKRALAILSPAAQASRMLESQLPTAYGEHDVDSVLHMIFAAAGDDVVFESLCNPPGGDWSGMSFTATASELRWTSLPRVTGLDAKRPDHVFQHKQTTGKDILLVVESKDTSRSVEPGIGPRLKRYVSDLIALPPSVVRISKTTPWSIYEEAYVASEFEIMSAAAFRLNNIGQLARVAQASEVEIVFGVEIGEEGKARVHVLGPGELHWLLPVLNRAREIFGAWLEVQIH